MSAGYLADLSLRLAAGVGRLPPELITRQAAFFAGRQLPDGGFPGREGAGDLYYTSFALRGLAICGELTGPPAALAAGFLRQALSGQVSIVDFVSLVFSGSLLEWSAGIDVWAAAPPEWRTAASRMLEGFRRPDGGYAKTPEGQSSSTYHTFLVVLCRQALGLPLVEAEHLTQFVQSRQRDDGGFVEIGPMRASGTNPTAAAVALLRILGGLDPARADGVVQFLLDLQNDEGGLAANTRVPLADALSTFTGLWTCTDLQAGHLLDLPALRQYVRSLEVEEGGFRAGSWDGGTDVEYTFYGLGALALVEEANIERVGS